jgi:stearoyl-CoA desaturase (delta-9 desaturase)
MSIGVVGPLVGVILAMILLWNLYVFWTDIALLFFLYTLTAFGVTIGYHRMLTHDGFRAPDWLRVILLILGSMAFAGSRPDEWAATHIKHHAHADMEGDPHSPLEGFWHAHFGWLFSLTSFANVREYAPHLLEDRVVQFVSRRALFWTLLAFLIPFALGGWTGLLWGGAVRLFLTTHITWSVNSVCHTFGRRSFETTDESRNHWLVGLLAFGEGWHNNHHAFPRNAFHGIRWWQFDLSGLLIRALEKCGLLWNVQCVSESEIQSYRLKAATMGQAVARMRNDLLEKIAAGKNEITRMIDTRMSSVLSENDIQEAVTNCESAARRLEEIQNTVGRSTHLRKQRLMLYSAEVQALIEQAKKHLHRQLPCAAVA